MCRWLASGALQYPPQALCTQHTLGDDGMIVVLMPVTFLMRHNPHKERFFLYPGTPDWGSLLALGARKGKSLDSAPVRVADKPASSLTTMKFAPDSIALLLAHIMKSREIVSDVQRRGRKPACTRRGISPQITPPISSAILRLRVADRAQPGCREPFGAVREIPVPPICCQLPIPISKRIANIGRQFHNLLALVAGWLK